MDGVAPATERRRQRATAPPASSRRTPPRKAGNPHEPAQPRPRSASNASQTQTRSVPGLSRRHGVRKAPETNGRADGPDRPVRRHDGRCSALAGFAALRSLAALAGRPSDKAAAVSGGQIVLAPGLGTLPVPPARHQLPGCAVLPGPACPAARTRTVSGSAPTGTSPLIS
jgi:hypothetical protein